MGNSASGDLLARRRVSRCRRIQPRTGSSCQLGSGTSGPALELPPENRKSHTRSIVRPRGSRRGSWSRPRYFPQSRILVRPRGKPRGRFFDSRLRDTPHPAGQGHEYRVHCGLYPIRWAQSVIWPRGRPRSADPEKSSRSTNLRVGGPSRSSVQARKRDEGRSAIRSIACDY